MAEVAPSILAADFARLGEEIAVVESAGVRTLHVDVMDGHFVPNISIGPPVVRSVRAATKLFLDVHLMIEDPDRYVPDFAAAGAQRLTVHQEACPHLHRSLQLIRDEGVLPGVVINPATPVDTLTHVLDSVDLVLVMSVNPGFGGQSLIEHVFRKIEVLRRNIDDRGLSTLIEVDGGIKDHNAHRFTAAGAHALVSGSGVFKAEDRSAVIAALKEA